MRFCNGGRWALAVACLINIPAQAAIYQVTINTSSINGVLGNLDLQFNPGAGAYDAATATVTGYSGGTLGAVLPSLGGVSGGPLPASVILANSSPVNDFTQAITFGSSLSFLVNLSGPAITASTNTPTSATIFAVSLYNSNFSSSLLSADASGAIGTLNINNNGTVTITTFPPPTGGQSLATITLVNSPEPSFFVLTALALGAISMARSRLRCN